MTGGFDLHAGGAQATSTAAPLVGAFLPARWRSIAPPEWLADWRVERVAVAGGELEAVECGAGPPLVLLPPLPGWKESFVALLPHLARHYRVLTFDLRARFDGAPNWDMLVADCEQITAARFGGPVAVLGHSFGGALALRWALAHPARVRTLVLSSAFARVFSSRGSWAARYLEQPLALAGMRALPERASAAVARRLAKRGRWVFDAHCDERVVEMVRLGVRHAPLALIRQRIGLALRHDVRSSLGEVVCPTLVLAGERDTTFAIASAEELMRGIGGAERAVVAEAGHLHPLSRPELLAGIAVAWLTRALECIQVH